MIFKRMVFKTRTYFIFIVAIFLLFLSACSSTQKITNSARTPIEQLLHSEAIAKSLSRQQNDLQLHIPVGAKVSLHTAGLTPDNPFVGEMISSWLGKQGYIVDNSENAQYRINVIVNALGTEFGETFFGIPPVSGSFIPISLPELAIYKSQNQTGYTNFHLDIYELPSNRFMRTTIPYTAETFYNGYTFLFMFSFNKTDLSNPPELRSLSRIMH